MPLHILIQFECDNCGHCDYSEPPKYYAKKYFKNLGYLFVGCKGFCDEKCKRDYSRKNTQAGLLTK